jgi:hypothetical protein
MTPDNELREREANARSRKVYSSAGMQKLRDDQRGPVSTPASAQAMRQSTERGTMERRHHAAGQQLFRQHEVERSKSLMSSRPQLELDKKHSREREELAEKNRSERAAMEHQHLIERDNLRRKTK